MVSSSLLYFKVEHMNRVIAAFISTCVVIATSSFGHADTAKPKNTPLPKRGTLSVSGGGGGQDYSIPGEWGGSDASTGDAPPVSGSVSRINKETWQVRMFNNSKDAYSANVAVIQTDDAFKQVKSDYFSVTLKPGEKDTRTFPAGAGSKSAELKLQGWKNLTPHKPAKDATNEGAPAPESAGSAK